jgi:hypothetical protein
MNTELDPNVQWTHTSAEAATITSRVAMMTDSEKDVRVEALYAKEPLTNDELFEFSIIMLGGGKLISARLAPDSDPAADGPL